MMERVLRFLEEERFGVWTVVDLLDTTFQEKNNPKLILAKPISILKEKCKVDGCMDTLFMLDAQTDRKPREVFHLLEILIDNRRAMKLQLYATTSSLSKDWTILSRNCFMDSGVVGIYMPEWEIKEQSGTREVE